VRVVRGSRICPVCDGYGWRPRRGPTHLPSHPDYEQPWDEYVEAPVADAEQHPHAMDEHVRERLIEQLDRDRQAREGDISTERYSWERERQTYDRKGSYPELRRSLDRLFRFWPMGYLQVRRTYLRGLGVELTPSDRLILEAAEEWIAREMRGPIRVPPWLEEHTGMVRQKSVAELARVGLSAGQIARALRIPKQKVKRLLAAGASGGTLPGTAEASAVPGEPERVRV